MFLFLLATKEEETLALVRTKQGENSMSSTTTAQEDECARERHMSARPFVQLSYAPASASLSRKSTDAVHPRVLTKEKSQCLVAIDVYLCRTVVSRIEEM
jgi:hypothetical protein